LAPRQTNALLCPAAAEVGAFFTDPDDAFTVKVVKAAEVEKATARPSLAAAHEGSVIVKAAKVAAGSINTRETLEP